jgi:hypothetical protein
MIDHTWTRSVVALKICCLRLFEQVSDSLVVEFELEKGYSVEFQGAP